MGIEKVAAAEDILEIAGEVDAIQDVLTLCGHVPSAQVFAKIHDALLEELNPDDLHVAAPMTQGQKLKYKKMLKMHRPLQKKWLCCKKPSLQKVKGGKKVWVSTCKFKVMSGKHKGRVMAMKRIVGRNPKARPSVVMMKGVKVKWCS